MRKHKGIPIANVYYMLAYAFEFVGDDSLKRAEIEEFDNQQDMIAALLESGISRLLKQGLHKEYLRKTDSLPMLRGKIDIHGTIANGIALRKTISCEFDELTEDNLFNQILKTTTLMLIASKDVRDKTRDGLKKEMLYFSTVRQLDPRSIRWDLLRFGRATSGYRFLISLCQLVIEGMLMRDSVGNDTLAPEISEEQMHRIYELFLLRYFQKEHPHLKPAAPQIPWAVDDGYTMMLPTMKSDITLHSDSRILIIDAKYYGDTLQRQARYDSASIHSGNLYQIYTYTKNMAAARPDKDVSGMLLYARTEAALQPDDRFSMDGNEIYVKTLDLARDFEAITNQLDDIASILEMSLPSEASKSV